MNISKIANIAKNVLSGKGNFFSEVTKLKQESHCTYKRNIAALLYNHCCSGRAISITYSECVSVTLGFQHAIRMRHFVICGKFVSIIFIHIIGGKKLLNIKIVF